MGFVWEEPPEAKLEEVGGQGMQGLSAWPGAEALSSTEQGHQRRVWHDLSTSDIASWPVEDRVGNSLAAVLGSGTGRRGFSGVSMSWMERG